MPYSAAWDEMSVGSGSVPDMYVQYILRMTGVLIQIKEKSRVALTPVDAGTSRSARFGKGLSPEFPGYRPFSPVAGPFRHGESGDKKRMNLYDCVPG